MGGLGSGYHYHWDKKDVVEDYCSLSINWLRRAGRLRPGRQSWLPGHKTDSQRGALVLPRVKTAWSFLTHIRTLANRRTSERRSSSTGHRVTMGERGHGCSALDAAGVWGSCTQGESYSSVATATTLPITPSK